MYIGIGDLSICSDELAPCLLVLRLDNIILPS
jgi:hypothetical protein